MLQNNVAKACSVCLSSACSTCEQKAFEEYKRLRQEQILKDLLKKLELPAKPNVTVDYNSLKFIAPHNQRIQALIEQSRREHNQEHRRVRKSIQQWRRRNSDEDGVLEDGVDYFPALYETEREQPLQTSYVMAERAPEWFDQDLQTAVFRFGADLRTKFVTSARLNIFLRRPEQFEYGQITTRLNIFQRFPNGTLGPKLVSKHLDLDFGEATEFEQVELMLDISPVQEWIENGPQFEQKIYSDFDNENTPSSIALYVEAIYEGENLVQYPPLTNEENEDENQKYSSPSRMFFELELTNLKSGRSRRNANTCKPGSNNTKCCLYDLVIDFEKIGWGFVIAPKRYNAYVCSGECARMANSQSMGRFQAAAAAKIDHFQCCHPKEYNGITILFVQENNNVLIRQIPNMVAKDCGCQ
uniref:TGF_BETA_2 domain-containing protein n=1 Tax=Meloidogyne hapla TaxID=6305 RepID=A0A1I8BN30_MELHA